MAPLQVKIGKDVDKGTFTPSLLPSEPPHSPLPHQQKDSFTSAHSSPSALSTTSAGTSPNVKDDATKSNRENGNNDNDDDNDGDDHYSSFYSSIPTLPDPPSTSKATTLTDTNKCIVSNSFFYAQTPHQASTTRFNVSLGTRTPMQIVAMSNLKLNNDIFSARSLSIHRRILVKNLLTLLYEMNPMLDWFDDGSHPSGNGLGIEGASELLLEEDEQDGWMEQTLNAAGLSDCKDANGGHQENARKKDESICNRGIGSEPNTSKGDHSSVDAHDGSIAMAKTASTAALGVSVKQEYHSDATTSSPLESSRVIRFSLTSPPPPSAAASTSASTSALSSSSSSSSPSFHATPSSSNFLSLPNIPSLPRPKSTELPQSLHNYLSAVFDVDWSVELPSTEDSLFTFGGSLSSSSSSSPSSGSASSAGTSPPGSTASSPSSPSYLTGSSLSSSPRRISASSSSGSSTSSRLSFSAASSSSSLSSLGSTSIKSQSQSQSQNSNPSQSKDSVRATGNTARSTTTITIGNVASNISSRSSAVEQHDANGLTLSSNANSTKDSIANTSNQTNNRNHGTTNDSNTGKNSSSQKSAPSTGTRKSTVVPGRRSSLMHSGQMPTAAGSMSRTSQGSNGNITTNTAGDKSLPGIPLATTMTPGYDVGDSVSGSPSQENLNSTSSTFSRRTSSLPPMKRPAPIPRNPSSDSVTSSAGLPRPLASAAFHSTEAFPSISPMLSPAPSGTNAYDSIGKNDDSVNGPSHSLSVSGFPNTPGPKVMTSIKARRQVSTELDPQSKQGPEPIQQQQQQQQQSQVYFHEKSYTARNPPQAPRQLIIGLLSPPSPVTSPTLTPIAPLSPPRSPARAASPSPSLSPSLSSVMTNGAPISPPFLPAQDAQDPSVSRPLTPLQHYYYQQQQQQQQHHLHYPSMPTVTTRSNSDDQLQIQSRVNRARSPSLSPSLPLSPPTSPVLLSTVSPLPPTSTSTLPKRQRPAAAYGLTTSKSSPDLSSTSVGYHSPYNSDMDKAQRPLPALPVQHQHQYQYQLRQDPALPQQHQHQAGLSLGFKIMTRSSSSAVSGHDMNGHHDGKPYPAANNNSSINGNGNGNSRWGSMKTMFGLKTGK
ncbi:hypothetical protein BG011_004348 [Mortierella polycephala]|uniref:Uncharacterized protein n=1 Tax=Mortierella polycephala TaxID=41804 RepID=A0A9P6PYI0_9FUNG|nr:hypothetical protein BG011_004348 [Mortierella polycephala]